MSQNTKEFLRQTLDELANFEEIAHHLVPSPGDIPQVPGIDIFGRTLPLTGSVGGDHIIYLDFNKRYDLNARISHALEQGRQGVAEKLEGCKTRAGVAIADVSGHRLTDALLASMLHQAFLLGALYELDFFGEITTRLFENVNRRFYHSSSVSKYLTLLYGEIDTEGKFRFITAAHPTPLVFSRKYDRFAEICPDILTTFPPIGTMPSSDDIDRKTMRPPLGFKERYEVNEITLMGNGDILLLFTDGLSEHSDGPSAFAPETLEAVIRENRDGSAEAICGAVLEAMYRFSEPRDDITLVIIKKG